MIEHLSRKEVLTLSKPTKLKDGSDSLEDMYQDGELFVSKDGELFAIGRTELPTPDGLFDFTGPLSGYEAIVNKYLANVRRLIESPGLYDHMAKGVFVMNDEDASYYFIQRRATAKEEIAWKKSCLEDFEYQQTHEADDVVKLILKAQALGIEVKLKPHHLKIVEKYNNDIKAKLPDLEKLLVRV